eukprot:SAG31_NODE_788_length_12088_cov_3.916090_4_plen_137_part_00
MHSDVSKYAFLTAIGIVVKRTNLEGHIREKKNREMVRSPKIPEASRRLAAGKVPFWDSNEKIAANCMKFQRRKKYNEELAKKIVPKTSAPKIPECESIAKCAMWTMRTETQYVAGHSVKGNGSFQTVIENRGSLHQ